MQSREKALRSHETARVGGWSEGTGEVSGVQHRCDMHAGCLMIYLLYSTASRFAFPTGRWELVRDRPYLSIPRRLYLMVVSVLCVTVGV